MSLEKICVSFETAKRLVEAGIVIKSCFHYDPRGNLCIVNRQPLSYILAIYFDGECDTFPVDTIFIPAPTAGELWNLLPFCIGETPTSSLTPFMRTIILNKIVYRDSNSVRWMVIIKGKLCEAMSEMLLWLKENGYLKC